MPSTKKNGGPKVFLRRLKRSIKRQHLAQTCHFFNPFHDMGLYNSVARNIYKKPYVVRIDGIFFDKNETLGNNTEKNKPIFEAIKNANGIIFQSEFDKKLVELFYGKINKDNIIINNGAEVNTKNISYRKGLNLPDKRIILCSSYWRKHKRLDSIVEVINNLNITENNYHLVILGNNADSFVKNDNKNITVIGHIEPENLYKYYKSSDLYIHIPWIDHCPNTLVEAIANSTPVVTSNQGGTKELVEITNAGIVSECDKEIKLGEYVDLYNPPEPDINLIVNDILKIFENYEYYKKGINTKAVNINEVAKRYIHFIKSVYLGEKGFEKSVL